MAFLGSILSTIGSAVLPKAINWIGKKISGTALGQAAQGVIN